LCYYVGKSKHKNKDIQMSAERAEPPVETTQQARHLELVKPAASADVTEEVGAIVHALDNELIPANLDEARAAIADVRSYDKQVRQGVREGKHSVDPDVAGALKDIAKTGVGFWRLSQTERSAYDDILAAKTPADLDETGQLYLEAKQGDLAALQAEAKARVNIDDALLKERSERANAATATGKAEQKESPENPAEPSAKTEPSADLAQELAHQERLQRLHLPSRFLEKAGVDADQFVRGAALSAMRRSGRDTSSLETKAKQTTAESTKTDKKQSSGGNNGGKKPEKFTQVDRVEYANGAQHLYATTDSGERIHISHDKVMEAYGYAGQTQGEREGLMGMYDEVVEQERSNGVKTLYGVDADGKKHPLKYDAVLEYYGHRGDKQGTPEVAAAAAEVARGSAAEAEQAPTGNRLKRALSRAKAILTNLQKNAIKANYATEEYLKDPTNRRRAIAGGVLGAAAVAVTATLLVKYGIHHGGSGTELSPTPKAHGGNKHGLTDQQILGRLSGNRKGPHLSDQEILQQLTGGGHQKHLNNQQVLEQLTSGTQRSGAEYAIHHGDMPWDVLRRAGVPEDEIMRHLDHAAKESGLSYSWHGNGQHRWIEVSGRSDTVSVIKSLKPYL
jgi:hypothetical protein